MIVNSLKISVYRGFPRGLESAHLLNSWEYLQLMGCKGIYIAKNDCKWPFVYVLGLIETVGTANKFGKFQTFLSGCDWRETQRVKIDIIKPSAF